MKKREKGITLVSLMIAIIILIILAGVAIATITNTNMLGDIGNATNSHYNSVDDEKTKYDTSANLLDRFDGRGYKEEYTSLTVGKIVKYDSNNDGTKEEWVVLRNENKKLEIVSKKPIGRLTLGHLDTSVNVTTDLDGDGTIGDYDDKAMASYNNAITRINDYCKEVVTAKDNAGVRSIGASSDSAKIDSNGLKEEDNAEVEYNNVKSSFIYKDRLFLGCFSKS